jgi:hypothetical protein
LKIVFAFKYLNDYFKSNFSKYIKMSSKNLRKFTGDENYKRVSSSRYEWATSIGAPPKKLRNFNCFADSTTGVDRPKYVSKIHSSHRCSGRVKFRNLLCKYYSFGLPPVSPW